MQPVSAGRSKLALELSGTSVLEHTFSRLARSSLISHYIVATTESEASWIQEIATRIFPANSFDIVLGGDTRQKSVANALRLLPCEPSEFVMVHDGARPFCGPDLLERVYREASRSGAAIAALPSVSTLKRVDGGLIIETIAREQVFEAQTPQIFRSDLLHKAHREAEAREVAATDDAQLLEFIGHPVSVVEGSKYNIKITHPADVAYANYLISTDLP
jgi:2-C-methyl-D-erythritol 4-phosphate cytidylyltransferase